MDNFTNLDTAIKENIGKVLSEIACAAEKAGRNPDGIKLMAVTKTKPYQYVNAAYKAGLRLFGENRVQEMEEKYFSFHNDASVHLIGHLQRNKAKKAAAIADSVDSIDKYETAAELDKHCGSLGRKIEIMLEFNTSNEESKSGYSSEDEIFRDVDRIRDLQNITITGLMTIAPFTDDEKKIRDSFILLRTIFNKLKALHPDIPLRELSMGMSSDYRIAIEEGSTIIRIGTSLFGNRG